MWFYLLSLLWFQYCSSAFPCWDITASWFWDFLMVLCIYHCDFLVCVFYLVVSGFTWIFTAACALSFTSPSWLSWLCTLCPFQLSLPWSALSPPLCFVGFLLFLECSLCMCTIFLCMGCLCHCWTFAFFLLLFFFYFKLSSLFVLSLYILKPLLWHKFSISRVSFWINFWINLP